jgi:hypothetical protein
MDVVAQRLGGVGSGQDFSLCRSDVVRAFLDPAMGRANAYFVNDAIVLRTIKLDKISQSLLDD